MSDLGKLRIDAAYGENIIQVYNSPRVCSLVINGVIADMFTGLVAGRFQLHGKIQTPDGEKAILVKMGLSGVMKIYCDDILIAKKWLPFG